MNTYVYKDALAVSSCLRHGVFCTNTEDCVCFYTFEKAEIQKSRYTFSVDWFSNNIPIWQNLFEQTNIKPQDHLCILEIGSYEGRSTTWMVDNILENERSLLLTIDTFKGSLEHNSNEETWLEHRFFSNVFKTKYPEKVRPVVGDSKEILPLLNQVPTFDIIYIDGSHETEDVYQDASNSFPLLKDGGLLIFDDYLWSMDNSTYPVQKAVNKFEQDFSVKMIHDGYQRAFVKGS